MSKYLKPMQACEDFTGASVFLLTKFQLNYIKGVVWAIIRSEKCKAL